MPYAAFRQDGYMKLHLMKQRTWVPCQTGFFQFKPTSSLHMLKMKHHQICCSVWFFAKHSASLKIALLEHCLHLIMSTVHLHHLSGSSQNLSAISQDPNVSLRGQVNGLEFHMFPSINTLRDEQYEWGSSARQRHCLHCCYHCKL